MRGYVSDSIAGCCQPVNQSHGQCKYNISVRNATVFPHNGPVGYKSLNVMRQQNNVTFKYATDKQTNSFLSPTKSQTFHEFQRLAKVQMPKLRTAKASVRTGRSDGFSTVRTEAACWPISGKFTIPQRSSKCWSSVLLRHTVNNPKEAKVTYFTQPCMFAAASTKDRATFIFRPALFRPLQLLRNIPTCRWKGLDRKQYATSRQRTKTLFPTLYYYSRVCTLTFVFMLLRIGWFSASY